MDLWSLSTANLAWYKLKLPLLGDNNNSTPSFYLSLWHSRVHAQCSTAGRRIRRPIYLIRFGFSANRSSGRKKNMENLLHSYTRHALMRSVQLKNEKSAGQKIRRKKKIISFRSFVLLGRRQQRQRKQQQISAPINSISTKYFQTFYCIEFFNAHYPLCQESDCQSSGRFSNEIGRRGQTQRDRDGKGKRKIELKRKLS